MWFKDSWEHQVLQILEQIKSLGFNEMKYTFLSCDFKCLSTEYIMGAAGSD